MSNRCCDERKLLWFGNTVIDLDLTLSYSAQLFSFEIALPNSREAEVFILSSTDRPPHQWLQQPLNLYRHRIYKIVSIRRCTRLSACVNGIHLWRYSNFGVWMSVKILMLQNAVKMGKKTYQTYTFPERVWIEETHCKIILYKKIYASELGLDLELTGTFLLLVSKMLENSKNYAFRSNDKVIDNFSSSQKMYKFSAFQ